MAQGYSQVSGVDYFDTFAPVAKLASIREILAMAAALDMKIHQIDIKSAFLNGTLEANKVIFMRQPPGYHAPNSPNKVCHLAKTLYGLKQSSQRWYQRLVKILAKLNFKQCSVDQAVFVRYDKTSLTIIVVHVDDCTITATNLVIIEDVKRGMK